MDDLYARLKPAVPALADADRAALRRSLFGSTETALLPPVHGTPVRLVPQSPRRPRRALAVAAALIGVVGLGGLLAVERGDDPLPPAASVPVTATSVASVPRVLLDAPGWSLTRVSDVPGASFGLTRGITLAPLGTFPRGPWASVDATDGTTSLDGTVPPYPDSTTVVASGVAVAISRLDRLTEATWTTADGSAAALSGWDLDDDMVTAIAASVVFDGGGASVPSAPAGWEIVDPDVAALLDRQVEYTFTDGTPPPPVTATPTAGDAALEAGRVMTVRLYYGTEYALRRRVSPVDGEAVAIAGETVFVNDEDGSFVRLNVVRGDWTWEVDLQGAASTDEALDLLDRLRVVDDATWSAALPGEAVPPDERPATVEALLDGVPLPEGFDLGAVARSDGTDDRYQVIAQVSGAVVCAWLDRWFSGDAALQREAAAALASTRSWPMLLEIAEQGGWSDTVWEWADAVNGGPGVATGAGPVPPTKAGAASALGCPF